MDLRQRLQLIVDATTGNADSEFRKLTGTTREMGATADQAANRVRAAAQRVADARETEARAAGQLRAAEARLAELRDSGRAKQSQLIAAEERAAAAQRGLQRAVHGTETALRDEQDALRGATRDMAEAEHASGLLENASGRVKGALGGLAAAEVGHKLFDIAGGFAEGARAAGQFATSTNASVEQAGAFLGLVGSLGLDLNDLLEIQAEYAQKAAASSSELEKLGAQLVRNDDGTVNWTSSLVSFLDQLQGVDDATERNRLGFLFLGEEGYKQLSRLVSSGVDVRDALEQIGTPFSQEDVRAAAEFDAQMMQLSLTGQRTSQTLGRALLPAVTGLLEGFGDVIGVLEDLGPVIVVSTAAAIAMGLTGWTPTAAAGARLATVTALVNRNLAVFRGTAALAGASAATLGVGWAGAQAAGRGLMGLAGGPLGVALIGLSVGYTLASNGAEDFRKSAHDAAVELESNRRGADDMTRTSQQLARELAQQAGAWERAAAAQRGAMESPTGDFDPTSGGLAALFGLFGDTTSATAGFHAEIEETRRTLGEFAGQEELAQVSTRKLSDLIAEGTTSGTEFGRAVQQAADAQADQQRTSGLAQAAIDAYNATTRDAVQTTLDLFSAQLQQSGGLIGLQQSIYDARDAVDDLKTPWNEVDEATNRVLESTLQYASDAADAAVAGARAAGTVVDAQTEAAIRGKETIRGLYETLQQPGLTDAARKQVQDLIHDLQEAQKSGDVEAILRLTGAAETTGELDEATKDRDTTVRVESRNGPAVKTYLDGLAAQRLSLIRVESRNGPAVREYVDGLADQRLSLIRVETRNGPAVQRYLDNLADQTRVAYIDVRERGGSGAGGGRGPTGAAMLRGAPGVGAAGYGAGGDLIVQQLTMVVQADATGRVTRQSLADAGREAVRAIGAYERQNGTGWRAGGRR